MIWHDTEHEAFDLETSGTQPEYALQPWRVAQGKAWVTSLATVRREGVHTIVGGGLNPTVQSMRTFLEGAIAHERRIVGWNAVFDIAWLLAYGLEDLVMQAKWLDGMLVWKHATVEPEYDMNVSKRKRYGLKACVAELWEEHKDYAEDVDFHDPSPEARAKLHRYNIRDTVFTLKAAKRWWGALTNQQQRVVLIEAECLPLVAAANLRGIPVDTLVARDLQQWLASTAEARLDMVAPLGVTEEIVRSPKQLATLLFDHWKLPVFKENTSKLGARSRSTDKEVLHELALGINGQEPDPRVTCLREYREALNNKTKFADTPLKSSEYNEDGCTHPQAMVFSTYTGRLTYASKQGKGVHGTYQTGFALHQEKRGKRFRMILQAPAGHTLVEFDAAGQEFKWMAVASRDQTMLQLCHPGHDPHCYMGARIRGWDYRETMARHHGPYEEAVSGPQGARMLGKLANFSLQYRTSAGKLCSTARVDYNIPMVIREAEHIHRTYRVTYPHVLVFWNRQIALVQRTGYAETMAGRRVQVVGDWSAQKWMMGSTAINYKIQGTGADQKYLALACIKGLARRCGARLAWDLHDGLYFFVPDAQVAEFASRGKAILDALPYQQAWGFEPPIPMTWDAHVGPAWGMLTDWKP